MEFWLKWNQYANNDALAMEFTPNFNENPGGFLIDPNAGEYGGTFGVGIGDTSNRNSIFFTRPSAGVWHHYAIVIDTTAAAGSEITPYVDGQPVSYQQESAETGQGAFANSTLYLFSRDGNSLFGAGELDELAIYNQPLSATTIFEHYHSSDVDTAQAPSFTVNPSPAVTGQSVTFNASGSTDSQGTITDYRWDLNGSGKYETDTGTSPTLTHAFEGPGTYVVGLETTDSTGAIARTTHTLTVTQAPPSKPALTLSGASGETLDRRQHRLHQSTERERGRLHRERQHTSDPLSSIKNIVFPSLSGYSGGGGTLTATPFQSTYGWSGAGASASGAQPVTVTNNAGLSSSSSFEVVPDTSAPSGGALSVNGMAAGTDGDIQLQHHREASRSRAPTMPRHSPRVSRGCARARSRVSSAPLPATSAAPTGQPRRSPGAPPRASRPAATAIRSPASTTWATRPASPPPCSSTRASRPRRSSASAACRRTPTTRAPPTRSTSGRRPAARSP